MPVPGSQVTEAAGMKTCRALYLGQGHTGVGVGQMKALELVEIGRCCAVSDDEGHGEALAAG